MALFQTNMDFHHAHSIDIASAFDPALASSTSPLQAHHVPQATLGYPGGNQMLHQQQQLCSSGPFFPSSSASTCTSAGAFPPPSLASSFLTPPGPSHSAASLFNIGMGAAGDLFRGQPSNLFLGQPPAAPSSQQSLQCANLFQEAHHNQLLIQQQLFHQQQQQQQQQQHYRHHLHHQQQHVVPSSFQPHFATNLVGALDLGGFDQDDFEFLASALSRAATPPPESLAASPDDSPASSPGPSEAPSVFQPDGVAFQFASRPSVHQRNHNSAAAASTPTSIVLSKAAVALGPLAGSSASPSAAAVVPTSPSASSPAASSWDDAEAEQSIASAPTAPAANPAPRAEEKVVVTRSSRVVRAPKLDYLTTVAQPAVPRVRKGKIGRPRKHPLPHPVKVAQLPRKATPSSLSAFSDTASASSSMMLDMDVEQADEEASASTPVRPRGGAAREVARRRETHNVSERQRRTEMKQLLEGLRTIVPVAKDDPKMHTSTILLSAVDFIKELLREETRILKKSAKIRSQNMQIKASLNSLAQ